MGFWLELGVDGFRVDAASHIIEAKGTTDPRDSHEILKEYREFAALRRGDVVLMGESDVEPHQLAAFFGEGDELQLLFNFSTAPAAVRLTGDRQGRIQLQAGQRRGAASRLALAAELDGARDPHPARAPGVRVG